MFQLCWNVIHTTIGDSLIEYFPFYKYVILIQNWEYIQQKKSFQFKPYTSASNLCETWLLKVFISTW